jgi:hypothetical protein
MFELALEKMRGSHTNMSRLQLKTEEATQHKTSDPAHASIVKKIGVYNKMLKEKLTEYQFVVTTHALPGINEPTTSELLRKKMARDSGYLFMASKYIYFVPLPWIYKLKYATLLKIKLTNLKNTASKFGVGKNYVYKSDGLYFET